MSANNDLPTPRRDFLGKLATSAVVLSGAACASPVVASQGTTAPAPAPAGRGGPAAQGGIWNDAWFAKLTAAHKAVFDSPGIEEGMAIRHVTGYLDAMRTVQGAEAQAVLVIRHSAIPMAFNNTMWSQYGIGKLAQIQGPGGADATANPYATQLTRLNDRGVILLACDLATRNYVGRIATAAGIDRTAAYETIKTNLLPGFILQPTGVYAFHRAQEAGCTGIRSTN